MREFSTDIVIVGSGPGGATLARELSGRGLHVLLLERGRDWRGSPLYGTYPGAMLYTDKASFLTTVEGLSIIRPLMLGGATSMYCACAADPPSWWLDDYQIDLRGHAAQARRELGIAPLPAELRGPASTRIAEAAAHLGQDWFAQDKFVSPGQARGFACSATCMLGCRCGAKWNAASYVDEARARGCKVWTRAHVKRVLIEDGVATGVVGHRGRQSFRIRARRVLVAAGGIGSAILLHRSGIRAAGQGMTMDTTVMVYGHAPFRGNGNEPPMTWSYEDDELGVMYSTLIDPWLNYPVVLMRKGLPYALSWYRWGHTLGVMIKLKDEISGRVTAAGRIHKGTTPQDTQRLAQAEGVAAAILRRAGCDPDTIFTTPLRGTHPSGTVRIGHAVNNDLQASVRNLYVCDASVFPEALARPTVLTIISLARRLAGLLLEGLGLRMESMPTRNSSSAETL